MLNIYKLMLILLYFKKVSIIQKSFNNYLLVNFLKLFIKNNNNYWLKLLKLFLKLFLKPFLKPLLNLCTFEKNIFFVLKYF